MSRGSKVVPVRIPEQLLAQIYAAIQRRNDFTRGEIWTLSDWVRSACLDKLDHGKRSRRSGRKANIEACAESTATQTDG